MKFALTIILAGGLVASASAAEQMPLLIPRPAVISVNPRCHFSLRSRPLTVPKAVDPGGLDILVERLRSLGLSIPVASEAAVIAIRHTGGPTEHYTLDVKPSSIAINASDKAAEMDALATLAQLISAAGVAPCAHVVDHPALAWRVVSDDVSRGPLPTMDYFATRIRRLASYKVNGYSPYLENVVVRAGHSDETRPDALTNQQLNQLSQLAARYHMSFVPEQETFGHMAALISFPQYQDVRENAYTDLISPATPRTYDVIRDLLSGEFSRVSGIRYIHIGGDETSELGTGRSRALVRARGYAAVYGGHIRRVSDMVHSMGARPLIWGDSVQKYPKILNFISHSTIIIPFNYDIEPSYDHYIAPLQKAGFDVLVAPSVANYSRFFPNLPKSTGNIGGFLRDAKRRHALGMFLTVWISERDELYDATWYPLAFGAAHAWESANERPEAFCPRFAVVTFGDRSACASFMDFAALDNLFGRVSHFDSPETLLRADWRVPYLLARLHLQPTLQAQLKSRVDALQRDVNSIDARRDEHQVKAMKVAADRYAILLTLLSGQRPNLMTVTNAENLHLSEWRYENRPHSATDQIENSYSALLPHFEPAAFAFPLPKIADGTVALGLQSAASWLEARVPVAAPDFLFSDPVGYIASAPGIDPAVAAPIFDQVNSYMAKSSDPAVHVTVRYLSAKIRSAELPFVIQRAYQSLRKINRSSPTASWQLLVGHILSQLGYRESDISALEDSYRELNPRSDAILEALDQQRSQVRAMETCFQTYIHVWATYGGAPGSALDDSRAHLPANIRAVFCKP